MEAAYSKTRDAIAEDLEDARRRVVGLEGILAAFDALDGRPVAKPARVKKKAPRAKRVVKVAPVARAPEEPRKSPGNAELQERVYQALKAGPLKKRELAANLGVDELELHYALQCLRKDGRIGVKGATQSARWERSSAA